MLNRNGRGKRISRLDLIKVVNQLSGQHIFYLEGVDLEDILRPNSVRNTKPVDFIVISRNILDDRRVFE